jgi:hypothetical protein
VGLKWACNIECAIEFTNRAKAKKLLKEQQHERSRIKERKAAIKPLSKWLQEAQSEFNKYIRLRDADKPCISCGCTTAIQWHAGHYRTTKAAGQHRFNEDNCNKQCSQDNLYHSGRISDYRIGLIERVGMLRVEKLENDNATRKWTIEDCVRIKAEYREKIKQLKINNE